MELEVDRGKVQTGKTARQKVARVIDREAGVVIYLFSGKEGIATIPISETTLE